MSIINFLHTYNPNPILINFGPLKVHWYGIFIITGILAGIVIILKLAEKYQLDKNKIIDSSFYLIISGILGARLYHVGLELPYYIVHPLNIVKIWEGGLAIHGAIIGGLLAIFYFSKKEKINFWLFTSMIVPALALAQAIGRWGNYFNQELFGRPTNLPWGIPIEPANRILEHYNGQFFHPTFLYESFGNLLIFFILLLGHFFVIKKIKQENLRVISYKLIVFSYLFLYSWLRLTLEFVRIDYTPLFLGLRWPQIISLLIIGYITHYLFKNKQNIKALAKK